MRRRAEAVDPKTSDHARLARETQCAEADQPRAEERSSMRVVVRASDGKAIARVRDAELCVSAIDVVAGEPRALAEILAAGRAVDTFAAGPAQPRNANAIASSKSRVAGRLGDGSDYLVAEHQRQLRPSQLAVEDVQIGPADRARVHTDQQLAVSRDRRRDFTFSQPGAGTGM